MHGEAGHSYSRKLLQEKTFVNCWKIRFLWENFHGLLACAIKRCYVPKFCRENFREQPQNLKICESFFPQSLPPYGIKTEEYETRYNSINSDQHQHLTGLITYQIKYGVNLYAMTCYGLLTSLLSCRQSHSQASLVSQQYWTRRAAKSKECLAHLSRA